MFVVLKHMALAVVLVILGAWFVSGTQSVEEFAPAPDHEESSPSGELGEEESTSVAPHEPEAPPAAAISPKTSPGPVLLYDSESSVSARDVVTLTNRERARAGLPLLVENGALARAALAKASDILKRDYFSHVAPDGTRPADLAERAGYRYILVGENLALGNFETDEEIVAGWMESTEHRDNILHKRYRDIGVAVLDGEFAGELWWVAVQTFGLPRSACPDVPLGLRETLGGYYAELDRLRADLSARYETLEEVEKDSMFYREEVEAYNLLARAFNELVAMVEELTTDYNEEVRLFNVCLEEATGT